MRARVCTLSVVIFLAAVLPVHAGADAATAPISARLDGILTHLVKTDSFSGTVLIARNGKVLLEKGYGLADRSRKLRDGRSTEYRIFDVTEQFTAMAVLELQERGKLSVADRLCLYVPRCPTSWAPITIQQLLTHESGIPSFTSFKGYRLNEKESPQQIVTQARTKRLLFEPGSGFEFSQTNYILLGLVVKNASGKPYAAFMQQNVFRPLGMAHTGLLADGVAVTGLARGYDGTKTAPRVDATTPWADAGLYATADDLYRWDLSLSTHELVSQKSLDAMFTPYVSVPPETQIGYGYGWLIGPLFHHQADFHEGNAGGFAALNMLFPRDGITIIILSNQGLTDTGSMYGTLAPMLLQVR